jgi:hypothetical protein
LAPAPAAVQLNVGPLVVPTARREFSARSVPLPPKLFSHNDQASVWQSSSPEGSTVGWGGQMGDLALASNRDALFTCISVAGNSVFLAGQSAVQYQLATSGAIRVEPITRDLFGAGNAVKDVLRTLVTRPRTDPLERAGASLPGHHGRPRSAALAGVTRTAPGGNPLTLNWPGRA